MKSILSILIACLYCLICSCYTKQQAIDKFCTQDSIEFTTIIHDTIIVDSIQVDSVFSQEIDSVYIIKDKIEIQYVKKFGKIYIQGKYTGDTIYREKIIKLYIPVTCPKLVWYKQLGADYWFLLPLILLIYISLLYVRKLMNNG
jgi:hypothetical protein